jgi:hypothetical protein
VHAGRAAGAAERGRVEQVGEGGVERVSPVGHQHGQQRVEGAGATGATLAVTGVDPRAQLGVPLAVEDHHEGHGVGRQRAVAADRGQLERVERHQSVEAAAGHPEGGVGEGRTVACVVDGRHELALHVVPAGRVPPAGAPVVPAGAVVAAALPRMAQRHQPIDTSALVEQEAKASGGRLHEVVDVDAAPRELGDGVTEHRRLGDGGPSLPPPERRMVCGPVLVVDVGDEAERALRAEEVGQLAVGPVALPEHGPGDGVEARVPQPLERVDRAVRDRVAARRTPVRLEHGPGLGQDRLGVDR